MSKVGSPVAAPVPWHRNPYAVWSVALGVLSLAAAFTGSTLLLVAALSAGATTLILLVVAPRFT